MPGRREAGGGGLRGAAASPPCPHPGDGRRGRSPWWPRPGWHRRALTRRPRSPGEGRRGLAQGPHPVPGVRGRAGPCQRNRRRAERCGPSGRCAAVGPAAAVPRHPSGRSPPRRRQHGFVPSQHPAAAPQSARAPTVGTQALKRRAREPGFGFPRSCWESSHAPRAGGSDPSLQSWQPLRMRSDTRGKSGFPSAPQHG